jgi:hypothetical protein
MTPEQIKRRYQDLLNNEIFLNDPIAWMHDDSEFIVMTAVTSYKGHRCYAKVALCEVQKGVRPKMISERAKGMRFIWELRTHLRKGRTHWVEGFDNSFEPTLAKVTTQRCAELNAEAARLNSPEHRAWLASEVVRFNELRAKSAYEWSGSKWVKNARAMIPRRTFLTGLVSLIAAPAGSWVAV